MPAVSSLFHYINYPPSANPTGIIDHCKEVVDSFPKLEHPSNLYGSEGAGKDFTQIPSPKNNDNSIGRIENCNSYVEVQSSISLKPNHSFNVHGDVPHDFSKINQSVRHGFLQNPGLPLHNNLRTSLPIRSFQHGVANNASISTAFGVHDSEYSTNSISKFQPSISSPPNLESYTDPLQGNSGGRFDTKAYQGQQLANNSIAQLNSYRKPPMEYHYQTQNVSPSLYPYVPSKYTRCGSGSFVKFGKDSSGNQPPYPPQALTNLLPLGTAPTSSRTNRLTVLTSHPPDLWENPPEVLGTHWGGEILSNNLPHPSNMSISCQGSQSYNDANISNENKSVSNSYPSQISESPYTQVAYQQHGSNHIDSHSPTLSRPSNSVHNQEDIHIIDRDKSLDLDCIPTVKIDQIYPRSFPSICLHPQCQCKRTNKPKLYNRYKDWQNHFKRAHQKRYLCGLPNCPNGEKRYGTNAEAKRHRLSVHRFGMANAKHWNCQVPDCRRSTKVFIRGDKYKDHRDKWHGPFTCQYPGCVRGLDHGFKDQEALDKHRLKEHRWSQDA
ncbi:hypothetical protein BOTCAL_0426g00090 [Botryotinia calthae]|uniref:C2H2-type domain-containing protein n=1 Tax=Botryotinia calthae TaxID=38488 RepID=A0A4Y8CP60_9HELO|nr:hypothetical protein BOTCAL_0426g00090 [Botryotinia calthae]